MNAAFNRMYEWEGKVYLFGDIRNNWGKLTSCFYLVLEGDEVVEYSCLEGVRFADVQPLFTLPPDRIIR